MLESLRRRLTQDRELSLSTRAAKGLRYVWSRVLAPWYLRACDQVGARARAIARPQISNRGHIQIGDDLVLNSTYVPCELRTGRDGRIVIGSGARINFGTLISATRRVTIGDRVSIGPHSLLADCEFGDETEPRDEPQPIDIADDAWLAARVTVLPGSRIGAGAVVTAGSIVSGDIPPGVVAGGIPARVLRPVRDALSAERDAAPGTIAPVPTYRGVILADFTPGDLTARLRDAGDGPSMEAVETPYGQVAQSLLAPPVDGATDFAIVWTRPESISDAFNRLVRHENATDAELIADVDSFCDLLASATTRYRATLVPSWTLPTGDRGLGMIDGRPGGLMWAMSIMNRRLMERLAPSPNAFVLDAQRWTTASRRPQSGAKAWYVGKIAFHGSALAEAAADIKAAMRGLAGHARKLLIVDLDDTLWSGIVGEVGWQNLQLGGHDPVGEALADFQKGLKRLARRGVVLGIVSKNTESVAIEAIQSHPEMQLRLDDFAAWRINWRDKAANVADLAAELKLGLQSVVFIDDTPVERARVREALPEVLVPDWPEDKLSYPTALAALRCFDTPAISREDANRTELYASERRREAAKIEVGSLDDWLSGLGTRVRAEPLGPANVLRTAQLLNKTNQMNLSTRRLTESELVAWAREQGRALWAVSVADRFGDAGLTGILGIEQNDGICQVVDFVLSCRVMGRKVEETMAHMAVECARARGARSVEAVFQETAKNRPCHEFWKGSGFVSDGKSRFIWDTARSYPLPSCVALEWNR